MDGVAYQTKTISEFSASFKNNGWVQLNNFLTDEFAEKLYQTLTSWQEWNLVTRLAGQHRSFDSQAMTQITPQQQQEFLTHVHQETLTGFQYLYERYPMYDRAMQQTLSQEFQSIFQLIRSPYFLNLLKNVSDCPQINFTDGQITRYQAGHFLTQHDDSDSAAGRELAFVLNLTKDWQADAGGLLQFFDQQHNVSHAIIPRFNSLTIFRVPQLHAVSYIPPFVRSKRYAVTGWGRAGVEAYPLIR